MSRASHIESMTGYGETRATFMVGGAPLTAVCRVRSLNHRFLDIKVRLPRADLLALDAATRKRIGEILKRGAIELSISLETSDPGKVAGRTASSLSLSLSMINRPLAKAYWAAAKELSKVLKTKSTFSIEALLRLPGVLLPDAGSDLIKDLPDADIVAKLVDPALAELRDARQREGGKLQQHLLSLLDQLNTHLQAIIMLEGPEKERARHAMMERAQETLKLLNTAAGKTTSCSDDFSQRLREEAVFWIERRDFEEERIRLGIHLREMRTLVETGSVAGSPDGIGRKLEFLQQEILREINTLGTKAQTTQLTSHTIEMKAIVERLREQLANVA